MRTFIAVKWTVVKPIIMPPLSMHHKKHVLEESRKYITHPYKNANLGCTLAKTNGLTSHISMRVSLRWGFLKLIVPNLGIVILSR